MDRQRWLGPSGCVFYGVVTPQSFGMDQHSRTAQSKGKQIYGELGEKVKEEGKSEYIHAQKAYVKVGPRRN